MKLFSRNAPQQRSGVLAIGQLCIDYIKLVNTLPAEGRTGVVYKESLSTGGAAMNLAVNLARLDYPDALAVGGFIGQDLDGETIIQACRSHRIDSSLIRATDELPSGYSDIFHAKENGRRISFLSEGANALLGSLRLEPEKLPHPYRYCYLGTYGETPALSLPALNSPCVASDLLSRARACGMQTLLDLCHTRDIETLKHLDSVLSQVDILLLNEEVVSLITQVALRKGSQADWDAFAHAGRKLMSRYPLAHLVIHGPDGSVGFSKEGTGTPAFVGSVRIPPSRITSTSGIRQAFAAGFLYALDNDASLRECLQTANAVAAASAMHETNSLGITSMSRCTELRLRYGERDIHSAAGQLSATAGGY